MENIPIYRRIIRKVVNLTASLWSDEAFVKAYYWCNVGHKLHLTPPVAFTEKIQWLKLNDKRQEFTKMVDKYEAKKYVASIIGEQYIIPTLGVWNRVEDIDFDSLPNKFVLKCTHDSGGVVICKDKSSFDKDRAMKKLGKAMKRNFIAVTREYPYKDVTPMIIAEEYKEDVSGELKDYKIFCFNGEPKFLKVDFDRFSDHHANYYNLNWELLDFGEAAIPPNPKKKIKCPDNLGKMIEIGHKLSKNIPFVRVDLYNLNGFIFFGELTFFPASGFGAFEPKEWDYKLGSILKL